MEITVAGEWHMASVRHVALQLSMEIQTIAHAEMYIPEERIAAILAEEYQLMEERRLNITTRPGETLQRILLVTVRMAVIAIRSRTDRVRGLIRITPTTTRHTHHPEAAALLMAVEREVILHHLLQVEEEATAEREDTNGDSNNQCT